MSLYDAVGLQPMPSKAPKKPGNLAKAMGKRKVKNPAVQPPEIKQPFGGQK